MTICKRSRTQATKAKPSTTLNSIVVEENAFFGLISMRDIITATATNNFSADLIASVSKFGFLYKAELPNGLKLTVQKLHLDAFQGFMEFRSELEILGKLCHRIIVWILEYYVSSTDRLLAYEFFKRGSLDNWLHDFVFDLWFLLSWETRHKIVRGVANGLAYMHECHKFDTSL
ncbi:hypothetical protein TIFTF001_017824 [Ficus carica]|uniref:Protein kinase domain-containing protein n=1 Tax=Ficus carica TaxID=3494 RepID=A0AA88D7B8_FICCA|nr:hypothetical protein TIFTF001_017824 [Ficus carica]